MQKASNNLELLESIWQITNRPTTLSDNSRDEFFCRLGFSILEFYLRRPVNDAYIERAGYVLEQLEDIVENSSSPELREQYEKLRRIWKKSVTKTSTVREYLSQFENRKIEKLMKYTLDKKIILIGGLKRSFNSDFLKSELKFTNPIFYEIDRTEGKDIEGRIRRKVGEGNVDYIVHSTRWSRHVNLDRDFLKRNNVIYRTTSKPFSRRNVLEILFECHDI